MTQHTPGPWEAERLSRTNQWSIIPHYDDFDRRSVASAITVAGEPPMNTEANARLIAAAPDLLAALMNAPLPSASGSTFATEGQQAEWMEGYIEWYERRRAALAKAEEGS